MPYLLYENNNFMKTKKEIEEILTNLLYDCLQSANQEDAIISLKYDEKNNEAIVRLSVHIVEEDNYVGFNGY